MLDRIASFFVESDTCRSTGSVIYLVLPMAESQGGKCEEYMKDIWGGVGIQQSNYSPPLTTIDYESPLTWLWASVLSISSWLLWEVVIRNIPIIPKVPYVSNLILKRNFDYHLPSPPPSKGTGSMFGFCI